MARLVVEEEIRLELAQEGAFSRPPRNMASSTVIPQSSNVRMARSCAGALRAVTRAVRMRMVWDESACC